MIREIRILRMIDNCLRVCTTSLRLLLVTSFAFFSLIACDNEQNSDPELPLLSSSPRTPEPPGTIEEIENPTARAHALMRAASLQYGDGAREQARQTIARGNEAIAAIPDGEERLQAADLLIETLVENGETSLAENYARGFRPFYISSVLLSRIAFAHLERGAPGDARICLAAAEQAAIAEGRPALRATSLAITGQIYLQLGEELQARVFFERADQTLGFLPRISELTEISAVFAVARSFATLGDREKAVALAQKISDPEQRASLIAEIEHILAERG